jgi:hypothetical protein
MAKSSEYERVRARGRASLKLLFAKWSAKGESLISGSVVIPESEIERIMEAALRPAVNHAR